MDVQPQIPILYEDDSLLAVNKPAGIVTIRDGYNPNKANLHEILVNRFGRLWVVHRLDVGTSGVVLFARTASSHRHLSLQFEHHAIRKIYKLLTLGRINWQEKEITFPLRIDGDRRHRTIIDPQIGKPAKTVFSVCEKYNGDISLLSALPFTGYTHQIRAHCSALNLWLVHDPLYLPQPYPPTPGVNGPRLPDLLKLVEGIPMSRVALHAQTIKFSHPVTDEPIELNAPIPQDFSTSVQYLLEK